MEKKTYFSPLIRIHNLAISCLNDGMSGGGTGGDENKDIDGTDAKSSTVSFDDWDDSKD